MLPFGRQTPRNRRCVMEERRIHAKATSIPAHVRHQRRDRVRYGGCASHLRPSRYAWFGDLRGEAAFNRPVAVAPFVRAGRWPTLSRCRTRRSDRGIQLRDQLSASSGVPAQCDRRPRFMSWMDSADRGSGQRCSEKLIAARCEAGQWRQNACRHWRQRKNSGSIALHRRLGFLQPAGALKSVGLQARPVGRYGS